jgi:hypothetical protein
VKTGLGVFFLSKSASRSKRVLPSLSLSKAKNEIRKALLDSVSPRKQPALARAKINLLNDFRI